MYNVRVREIGRENLPTSACVYIFSHTSFFDIFAMAACLKGMRFGAKIELFKIPFFGRAMKMAGVLPIARSNREKVLRVYQRAGQKTEQGYQFSLAPEGARNTEEKLLPFKSGPFIFAISAQIPLIPVVVKGAYQVLPKDAILPNWKRWSSEITLQYLPGISTEGILIENRSQLQRIAFDKMAEFFPGSVWK
jgi:1-acyl-sn-glycerol-3-phosphate acyltransferase